MEKIEIQIDGKQYIFPAQERSDASDEKERKEEDEHFAGPDTLQMFYQTQCPPDIAENKGFKTQIDWVMFMLPMVAKHYGVDRRKLEKNWVQRYLVSEAYKCWLRGESPLKRN